MTHQIYASRYMNGSVAVATVVSDEAGRFYLAFADISRSDAIGGLFSGIKRGIVTGEGEGRVKDLLESAKTRLEAPADRFATETKPARSSDEAAGSLWSGRVNATALIAGVGILVLIILGIVSYRHRIQTYQERSG